MAKSKTAESSSYFQELFKVGLYKRSQGRVTRQVTFASLAIIVGLGCWALMGQLELWLPVSWGGMHFVFSGLLAALGWWMTFRAVNYAPFADFLIAVEAEMAKVSWPTRTELTRSATVVIIVIFLLAAILFGFDLFWQFFFKDVLGVLHNPS